MIAALLLAAATAAAPARDAPDPGARPLRRFALVVGANDGGVQRPRLRYARSDAERLAHVLQQLGGLEPQDTTLLLDPSESELRGALGQVNRQVAAVRGKGRVEVLLYYSGHSDDEGLLVRGALVPYADLRGWLEATGADVRIAILDSCSSGAFTQRKGGYRAPPFLVDTSTRVTGHAILTSSAADEASQESDRIQASFFTYYLVTGLRGAADSSLDGRVTLSEAYQYAFQETLAHTERTRSGPQHPAWDIQLVGSGDLVMTELRGGSAALVLPEPASGRYFVRDARRQLVAEVRKVAGRPVELGLDPGEYRVVRDEGEKLAEGRVLLASAGRVELQPSLFEPVARERTATRGDEPAGPDLARIPVDLSIFPPVSINGDRATENHLQLGLVAARSTRLHGAGIAPVLWTDELRGVQLGLVGASVQGPAEGAQISGVASVARTATGLQLSGVLNLVATEMEGIQVSHVVNWTHGQMTGLQIASVANYAGQVQGLQSALVDVAGDLTGAQVGLVNVGRQLQGLQLSLVNVGGDVNGAQIGLVNVARKASGLQLGLVNVASEMDGAPVGLLSLAGNGEVRLMLLGDQDGTASASLTVGSRLVHSILWAGVQRHGPRDIHGLYGAGLGTHLAAGDWSFDLDLLAVAEMRSRWRDFGVTLRPMAGYALARHLELVAGPTLNLSLSDLDGPGRLLLGGAQLREFRLGAHRARLSAGFTAGLRF